MCGGTGNLRIMHESMRLLLRAYFAQVETWGYGCFVFVYLLSRQWSRGSDPDLWKSAGGRQVLINAWNIEGQADCQGIWRLIMRAEVLRLGSILLPVKRAEKCWPQIHGTLTESRERPNRGEALRRARE